MSKLNLLALSFCLTFAPLTFAQEKSFKGKFILEGGKLTLQSEGKDVSFSKGEERYLEIHKDPESKKISFLFKKDENDKEGVKIELGKETKSLKHQTGEVDGIKFLAKTFMYLTANEKQEELEVIVWDVIDRDSLKTMVQKETHYKDEGLFGSVTLTKTEKEIVTYEHIYNVYFIRGKGTENARIEGRFKGTDVIKERKETVVKKEVLSIR